MLPTYLVKPLYWPVKLKTIEEIKILRSSKFENLLINKSQEISLICTIKLRAN